MMHAMQAPKYSHLMAKAMRPVENEIEEKKAEHPHIPFEAKGEDPVLIKPVSKAEVKQEISQCLEAEAAEPRYQADRSTFMAHLYFAKHQHQHLKHRARYEKDK